MTEAVKSMCEWALKQNSVINVIAETDLEYFYITQNRTIREKILIDLEIINLDILDEEFYEYQDDLEVMVKNYIVEHIDD